MSKCTPSLTKARGSAEEITLQGTTAADNNSTFGSDFISQRSKYACAVGTVHRSSFDDHSDDIDDDHSPRRCYRPMTRQEMHEAEPISSGAERGAWPRNSSYSTSSVSRKSRFSASNAAEAVPLQSTDYVLKSAKEALIFDSTPKPRPSSSPRRPISALPRTPRSRHHQRCTPLLSPPSTPPGPAVNPSCMFAHPPVQLELPSVESTIPVVLPWGGDLGWGEKQLSWGTMKAMMAGQHSNADAAVTEAQVGAVQAIIQANYDAFLASKRMASRLPEVCKTDSAHRHKTENEVCQNDRNTTSSTQSDREAFERIFMGEHSVSDGSRQDSVGTEAELSTVSSSRASSSRTSSYGTGAAAASACAGEMKG